MASKRKKLSNIKSSGTDIRSFLKKTKAETSPERSTTQPQPTNITDSIVCTKCQTEIKRYISLAPEAYICRYDLSYHEAFDCPPKKHIHKPKEEDSETLGVVTDDNTDLMAVEWHPVVKGLGIVKDFITEEEAKRIHTALQVDSWDERYTCKLTFSNNQHLLFRSTISTTVRRHYRSN
jgi:hypothetical protein